VISGVDLHLDVPGRSLRAGLTIALREAVRSGRLPPGTRLPSSRGLAADLGIARNTVAAAYTELVAEGWLTARQGDGTRVARLASPQRAAVGPARPSAAGLPPAHDLRAGLPDVSAFPRADWLRAARRALARAPADALTYGSRLGRAELRTALAGYLARTRGVAADPSRIVVCSGATHGLMLLAAALRSRAVRAVAVEAYGLDIHRGILDDGGLETPLLALDGRGARVDHLPDLPGAGAVLLTPAHQFPIGVALHPERRAAVIEWARSTGGLVVEDDYDGEFRYDRQPVGALQGLAPDRVVYLGTTSKALAPGLRLGWMVVPDALLGDVERVKEITPLTTSTLDQLTLADMLESATYDRHVRAMRLQYRRRRDELVAALAARVPVAQVVGIDAGLHAVVELPAGLEDAAVEEAARHGLAVYGISRFRHPSAPPDRDAVVVGYGTPTPSAWSRALEALCRALQTVAG
jgi:GntR family transcriptional regulator / MocR family aminotransferase